MPQCGVTCMLQFVPNELKDEKYWARRRKNNMAAKRSRDARRLKENQIAMRANFLEKEVSKFPVVPTALGFIPTPCLDNEIETYILNVSL